MPAPLVAVIMGSKSDWDTMSHAAAVLDDFAVPYVKQVVSAHRTPAWMAEFAQGAEGQGLKVIIAGAGGAAHLPGMVAAHTTLPVLGVPVQSAALNGLDSLLSIVQMPARRAGGHAGHRQAGRQERRPARRGHPGHCTAGTGRAPQDLPRGADPLGAGRQPAVNRILLPGATLGVLGGGQLGRMFAIAARRMGYRVHTLSPGFDTPTGQVADVEIDADFDDLDAIRAFARGVDVITFEFENVSTAAADTAAEESFRSGPAATPCTSPSNAPARRRSCA